MIKFYIPDGHLEPKTLSLFQKIGYDLVFGDRAYSPTSDDPELELKRLRPQDFPYLLAMDKGDLGIVGLDILTEFQLEAPEQGRHLKELLDLGVHSDRLVVAVSEQIYPDVLSMADVQTHIAGPLAAKREMVVATEYPALAEQYLKKNGINATIRQPAGKTEAWIVPPHPEADLIIETVETGRTLLANRCRVIDEVMTSSARLVANVRSLEDPAKKDKISEILELFRGALSAAGMVNVYMDVVCSDDLEPVLNVLSDYVQAPTISDLRGGGYDVFVVIHERDLKFLLPKLRRKGASSIVVSEVRMLFG